MIELESVLKNVMAMIIRLLKSREFVEGLFLIFIISKIFKTIKE